MYHVSVLLLVGKRKHYVSRQGHNYNIILMKRACCMVKGVSWGQQHLTFLATQCYLFMYLIVCNLFISSSFSQNKHKLYYSEHLNIANSSLRLPSSSHQMTYLLQIGRADSICIWWSKMTHLNFWPYNFDVFVTQLEAKLTMFYQNKSSY